jgi:hypothetical protein
MQVWMEGMQVLMEGERTNPEMCLSLNSDTTYTFEVCKCP